MSRTRFTLIVAAVVLAVVAVPSALYAEDGQGICPTGGQVAIQAGCYYPTVSVNANPSSVSVGGSSTVSYTITGGDPAQGCFKTGAWSGGITLDGAGNRSGSQAVGPFGSAGQFSYGVTCPANPQAGSGSATVTVSGAPPPPPPPGPPPLPAELTCCTDHGSTSSTQGVEESDAEARAAGVVLPLNWGTGGNATNKCWKSIGKEYRHQGIWPYHRGVRLVVHWCAVKGVRIVGSSVVVDPYVSGGGQCSINGTNKFVVQGGNGYHAVVWQGKAFFKCHVLFDLPFVPDEINLDQWVQGVYYDLGGHFTVKTGGS